MSRASALRDAIVCELQDRLACPDVQAFLVPDYEREEFKPREPKIGVRIGGRSPEISIDGGPDKRNVTIEIGVIGLSPEAEGITNKKTYRQQQLEQADEYDAVMEQIIDLWTPWGPLAGVGLAEHRFIAISQPQAFDAKQLYDNGVWLAIVAVEFEDTRDEPEQE